MTLPSHGPNGRSCRLPDGVFLAEGAAFWKFSKNDWTRDWRWMSDSSILNC